MIGLLFFGVVGLWIWGVFRISRWSGGRVAGGRWRWPIAALVFAVMLPLPVLDELIARPQIETLCREGAVFKIDEQKIKGRRVKYSAEPLNERMPGTAIPVSFTRGVLRDAETAEGLGSFGWYTVKGGILIRVMGASESNSPLFARSGCAPSEGEHEAAKRVGFTIIN